jgi:hypothetical protein
MGIFTTAKANRAKAAAAVDVGINHWITSNIRSNEVSLGFLDSHFKSGFGDLINGWKLNSWLPKARKRRDKRCQQRDHPQTKPASKRLYHRGATERISEKLLSLVVLHSTGLALGTRAYFFLTKLSNAD